MILTSLAIGGGALAISVKVYRDKKREKEYPGDQRECKATVAAERMAKKDRARVRAQKGFWANLWPQGAYAWMARRPSLIERLSLNSPPKPATDEISAIEQELNRELAVVVGTLGLRVVGGLGL